MSLPSRSLQTLACLGVPILLALFCTSPKEALVDLERSISEDPASFIQTGANVLHSKDTRDREISALSVLQYSASPIILRRSGGHQLDEKKGVGAWNSRLESIWDKRGWSWYLRLCHHIGVRNYFVSVEPVNQTLVPVGDCFWQSWFPIVELLALAPGIYFYMRDRVHSAGIEEGARSCCMIAQFMNFLGFTIVIVDSYRVSQMVGGNDVFSGCLLGFFMAGSGMGYAYSWSLLSLYPNVWRSRMLSLQCTAGLLGAAGAAIYCAIVFLVPTGAGIADEMSQALLVLGRLTSGFSQGFCTLFNRVMIARITPPENRVQQGVRYQFWTTMGMGLGPMFAAFATLGAPLGPFRQIISIQHVGIMGIGTQLTSLFVIIMLLPDISTCTDQVAIQEGGQDGVIPENPPVDHAYWRKKRIVITCLALLALRSYVTAGLESITSRALQYIYKWSTFGTGFTVSCTYLVTIPVVLAFSYGKNASTPAKIAMGLIIVQVLSTFLLYPFSFLHSGWYLILSDCIVFPLMSLGDGMLIGRMDMLKFPEGTFFNVNNRTLVSGILTNGFARLLGPIMTQWIYSKSGLMGYAIQQTVCLFVSLLFFLTIYSTFGQAVSAQDKLSWPSWPSEKRTRL